jgi:hypothetical protein
MAVGAIEGRVAGNAAIADPEPRLPFFFPWVLEGPVSVWWLAAGLAALQGVLSISLAELTGTTEGFRYAGTPIWESWTGLVALVYMLWYAWLPLAIFYLVSGAECDLESLAPLLGGEEERGQLRAETLSLSPRALAICAGVGCVLTANSLALILLAAPGIPVPWPWGGAWLVARELVGNFCTAVILGWGLVVGARLSGLVRSRARISLLDTTRLSPLAQNGTRLALVWLVTFSIGIPTVVVPGGSPFLAGALLVTFIGMASAAVAVAVPLLGARRLLGELKAAELARVRAAIDSARRAALDVPESGAGARAADRLPGLLAWEARVAEIPVWLLDLSAWRKLALYLLIPLASWVCAALVERLIDSTLS